MNKKEFYKELMLSYTVDTEKVKRIAKRRIVKRSGNVMRWVSGAAACAAVTAAAVALVSLGTVRPGEDIDMTGDGNSAAMERLEAAMQYSSSLHGNAELLDMYVSFEDALSFNELLMTFSAVDENGDIRITLLYTAEGQHRDTMNVPIDLRFCGAKITAPASMCADILLLKTVSLVEFPESGITDDSFIPFDGSQIVTSPEQPGESIEIALPNTGTSTEEPDTDATSDSEDTDPTVTEPSEPDEPSIGILIPVSGANTVNIISADRIVITTDDSIRLYRLSDGVLTAETTFYASNAKVSWSSYDGTRLFITACQNGSRSRLYWADGRAGVLTELDISSITSDGAEISSVSCTPDGGTAVLKTVSADKTRIYLGRLDSTLSIGLAAEFDCPAAPLALTNNILYLAITDTGSSTVRIEAKNLADGTVTELAAYGGTLRSIRSHCFNSAALTFTSAEGEETHIMLTPEGTLTELRFAVTAFSLTDGSIFTDGEQYYRITDGELQPVEPEEAIAAFLPAPTPGDYTYMIGEDGNAYLMLKEQ